MRRAAGDGGAEERALARLLGHRFGPLVEALAGEESFEARPMFGCLACYAHGRLMLVLADRRPPWSGVLVVTDRARHAALRALVPRLRAHPVLGKWLHLAPAAETFEEDATRLAELARAGDARIGVEPPTRLPRGRGGRVSRGRAPARARRRPSRRGRRG
jgi:hypothetical protein